MKYNGVIKAIILVLIVLSTEIGQAQELTPLPKQKSDFWQHVQFGGGLGGSFGSGYSNFTIAPGALYNFNKNFGLGVGLKYTYIRDRDFYSSHLYGGSVVGIFNPWEFIQLSLEVEQLRVTIDYEDPIYDGDDFWNTALFAGAAYRSGSVAIGLRYNILSSSGKDIYGSGFMPFIRAYF